VCLPIHPDAWSAIVRYILSASDRTRVDVLAQVVEAEVGPETKELIMSVAERLYAEGRVEGRVEGQLETLRRILAKQLRLRFGAQVTDAVFARIAAAELPVLERWTDRILTANALTDVLAED
jgi:predicted transposase YdaD